MTWKPCFRGRASERDPDTTGLVAIPPTAAAPAESATTTIAAAAARAATILARASLVHRQVASLEVAAVQRRDGGLGFLIGVELDEPKPLAATGVSVHHDLSAPNRSERAEQLLQLGIVYTVAQVANVQLRAHRADLLKRTRAHVPVADFTRWKSHPMPIRERLSRSVMRDGDTAQARLARTFHATDGTLDRYGKQWICMAARFFGMAERIPASKGSP